jgi:glycosyltransferase involved in cell wall biosynthesis
MKVSEIQCLFSIVIPTYNRAHLISRAIDSVVNQTYKNWELIIVDDGSTDNTKELVENYTRKDNRIRYVYQENAERSAARNKGVENAKGEYVCFLDSDDYYLDYRLKNLHKYIVEKSFQELFIITGKRTEDNEIIETNTLGNELCSENYYLDNVLKCIIHCQQVCISTSIIKKHFFNEQLTVSEDMELWLRIADTIKIVCLSSETSVVIVNHEERTVVATNYQRFLKQLLAIQVIFGKGHPGSIRITTETKRFMFSYVYFGIAKFQLSQNKRFCAIYFMLKSIIGDINNIQLKHRILGLIHTLNIFKKSQEILNKIEYGNY